MNTIAPSTEVSAVVARVDPGMAESLLTGRANNRRVSKSHVKWLATQITDGKWGLNGQPIIIDTKNRVIDGQHRLHAIIEAGKPVDIVLVRGVAPKQFATIDTGMKRTNAHVLQSLGVQYAFEVSALIGWLYKYQLNTYGGMTARATNDKIVRLWKSNQGCTEAVRLCHRVTQYGYRKSIVSFAYYYTDEITLEHPEEHLEFWGGIIDPDKHDKVQQARILASYIWDSRQNLQRLRTIEELASLILAWNAFIEGRTIKRKDLVWIRRSSRKHAQPMPRFAVPEEK